jgi:hypothetical protein
MQHHFSDPMIEAARQRSPSQLRAGALLMLATLATAACSGGTTSNGSAGNSSLVTQKGRTIQYVPCGTSPSPVAGATVTVGNQSTTTAKDGTYSILVPSGMPFTMTVEKTTVANPNDPTDLKYVKLIEAEDTVTASYNRGDTKVVSADTAGLLSSALPMYDTSKAVITIELVKTGSCTDVGGTTVSVSSAGASALTEYPASCISPDSPNTSATDGVFPGVVVYNLAPGTHTVTASSPKCTQVPYPYTDPSNGLTYDGTVLTEAGTGASFVRVFLK